ncbi:hypothetical protein JW756_01800 [Candidatus Woesearchaeota archaeon]|nr:hypothetical protein [Candidatus Woesearchaeota archaeon]
MFKKYFFSITPALFIVFFILTLVIMTGCTTKNQVYQEEEISGFMGGLVGLKIALMDGAPPSVILDEGASPFSFIVTLENAGEAPVGPNTANPLVVVRLVGILHRNFGLSQDEAVKTVADDLDPTKRNFDGTPLPGEITYVSFDNLAYTASVPDSLALTMRAEVCYDYESLATTKLCMKRDVLETWEDASICTLKGPKPVGNAGSPLHITRVEEAPINNKTVQINFVIEHLGNGVFFYRNEYSSLYDVCVFDETNPHIYKLEVFVEPIQKDAYDVKCMRLDNKLDGGGVSGKVAMFEGAPLTISCFLTRTKDVGSRIYQDLLNIRLKYRYGEFVEVPILIQSHP